MVGGETITEMVKKIKLLTKNVKEEYIFFKKNYPLMAAGKTGFGKWQRKISTSC